MPAILDNIERVGTCNAVPNVFEQIPSPETQEEAEALLREMHELRVQTYAPDAVFDLVLGVASPVFTVTAIGHGLIADTTDTVFRSAALELAREVSAFLSHAQYWQAYTAALELVGGKQEARRIVGLPPIPDRGRD